MRILKIILVTLILGAFAVSLVSCASKSDSTSVSENQIVTVQRGNLAIDVTAVGNLALSLKEDLAFQTAGYVEEILVEEGESVEEGQVLASLDTASLEEAVKTAERAVQTAELAVQTAELAVQTAETGVKTGELAVKSAEIDLEQATNDYQELTALYPYVTYEFVLPESVDTIGVAQARIEEALEENQEGLVGEQYSMAEVKAKLLEAQELLEEAKTKLAWGFGAGVRPTGLDYWTLRATEMQVEKARLALDTARNSLDKLKDTLDTAKNNLDKAKISLDIAKDDLDRANDELEKAVILAPFAGFITKVNVDGGDEVMKGTVAVQLADPDKFEADLMVNEMDILQVKLGGEAWVQVDAMQGMSLPAKVTHISPTATIQSGVVNYKVKVEVESLQVVQQEWQETRQQGQGEHPRLMPTMIPEDFQLREGLTVTVSILVDERNDVLLVPNQAITRRGMETLVQVLKDGVIEERSITTGISNWQYTEVTDGLSEGEKVVIPQGTTATPTTPQQRGPMPFIPGH